jgi:DNA polymerase-3 subunit beta
VRYGATTLVSQAVAGRFPNYRGVLPCATAISLTVNRSELLGACRRARVFARDMGGLVRLHLGDDQRLIVVADLGEEGDSRTTLPVGHHEGAPLEIGFNADFLIEALGALDTKDVSLKFNGAEQPGLIDLVGVQPFVHAIMPMQIETRA